VVNYLKACPLPEAAVAVAELEKIDPEAVRRAATLAGLAAVAASAPAAGDASDEGADGGATSAVAVAPTAEDTALAATIAPVLADEDATDGLPGLDPNAPPAAAAPSGGNSKAWRWAFWAAAVLLVAGVSRSLLKPSGRPGPPAR